MKPFIDKEYIKTTLQRLRLAILTLIKWMLCSIASGIVIGLKCNFLKKTDIYAILNTKI